MKCAGFTLIELLVVIAVIALLIAISLPSLQNSRQHAKAIICSSNVKQLILGLTMYETENRTFPYALDDTLLEPPPGGYPGHFQYDRRGWWWFNHIIDYSRKDFDKDSVIWCPSRKVKNTKLKNNVLCGNYGVNNSICKSSDDIKSRRKQFVGTPLSSSDIQHPGRTLLIVDSGYSIISWWHVTDVPPVSLGSTIEDAAYVPGLEINKKKDLWPGQERDAINGRHPNRTVNIGFVDGHVSRKKANDSFVEKIAEDYKNKSPFWQPVKTNND
jgi:prepilin-type N-terminal cleavage/methylation domain-containing protein/prepilin-type processing-associated H-X9-DG protein